MTALLARLLTAPRWLVLAGGIAATIASHSAAYTLGATFEFRAGFAAGKAASDAAHTAATRSRTSRQLQDRLNAERALSSRDPDGPDRLRCGPSTRDCPR